MLRGGVTRHIAALGLTPALTLPRILIIRASRFIPRARFGTYHEQGGAVNKLFGAGRAASPELVFCHSLCRVITAPSLGLTLPGYRARRTSCASLHLCFSISCRKPPFRYRSFLVDPPRRAHRDRGPRAPECGTCHSKKEADADAGRCTLNTRMGPGPPHRYGAPGPPEVCREHASRPPAHPRVLCASACICVRVFLAVRHAALSRHPSSAPRHGAWLGA
jgi:hypothetical protein